MKDAAKQQYRSFHTGAEFAKYAKKYIEIKDRGQGGRYQDPSSSHGSDVGSLQLRDLKSTMVAPVPKGRAINQKRAPRPETIVIKNEDLNTLITGYHDGEGDDLDRREDPVIAMTD